MKLPQRWSRAGRTWALGGVGLSLALVVGVIQPIAVATAEPSAKRAVAAVDSAPTLAADMFGARINAVRLHHRVEALSERTETTQVFANPDGTTSREEAAAPVRVKDAAAKDGWRDIDLDLAEQADGSIAPKVPLREVTLSAGGSDDAPLVSLDPSKTKSLSLDWDGELPKPKLDGATATYEDIAPDIDLVVTATRFGFEQSFVIKDKPADLTAIELPLAVKSDGLAVADPSASDESGMQLRDDSGKVVGAVSPAVTWDSSVDRSGQPDNTTVSDLTLEKVDGASTLTLKPDAEFLADPATQYPVTIDPSFTVNTNAEISDTYVRSDYPTTNYVSSTELQVGTYNSGTSVARSYLKFAGTDITGNVVKSASLKIWEFHSYSCTNANLDVYASSTKDFSVSTWNSNQPGLNTSTKSTISDAKGYSSSCAAGWLTLDVTDATKYWVGEGKNDHYNYGLRASETSNSGWKRFDSSDGTHVPVLTVSYNVAPTTPTSLDSQGMANAGSKYVATAKPTLFGTFTDIDSDTARLAFEVYDGPNAGSANKVSTCTTGYVSPDSTASCAVTSALSDNLTYWYRAQAQSSYASMTSGWSGMASLKTAIAPPPLPKISCEDPYSNGSWLATVPSSSVTCTVTPINTGTNSTTTTLDFSVDEGAVQHRVSTMGNAQPVSVTIPNSGGPHSIVAMDYSVVGATLNTRASYGFGSGSAGMIAPRQSSTTTDTVGISAQGPPKGPSTATASMNWRVVGSSWSADVPIINGTFSAPSGGGPVAVNGYRWSALSALKSINANTRRSTLLEIRVCFSYSSGATRCTTDTGAPTAVLYQPHAFGNGFPTTSAGEGTVALWSGELAFDVTDVDVPTSLGSLTINRSHASFLDPPDAYSGVFGPGWAASFGDDSDSSSYQVVDSTEIDGTIAFNTPDGAPLIFREPGSLTNPRPPGTYTPVGDAATTSGYRVEVGGSGTQNDPTTLSLTTLDGAKTTWVRASSAWVLQSSAQAASHTTVTYTLGDYQRVRRILAPVPDGVTCGVSDTDMNEGCSALFITYAGTGTATRVTLIEYRTWDPAANGLTTTPVAQYSYDGAGRLSLETDVRTGLKTAYEYGAYGDNTVVTKVTRDGFAPYVYTYDASPLRLKNVQRGAPDGGASTSVVSSFVYNAPLSSGGTPDLSSGQVAKWAQSDVPTKFFAEFGPDHPVYSTNAADLIDNDWGYATLHYTDDDGYETDTAEYGAGRWLTTAYFFDEAGRPRYSLDPANTGGLASGSITNNTAGAALTRWNADVTIKNVFVPAHTYVTDSWSPMFYGNVGGQLGRAVRVHTHYVYDEGAPNDRINTATGKPYLLVTTQVVGVTDAMNLSDLPNVAFDPDLQTTSTTKYKYDPIDSAEPIGATSGWTLGQPTQTITVMPDATDNVVRQARYDADGNVVESREPGSNGSDTGTTVSIYYSAGANTADSDCGNSAKWAGLLCWSGPAAPPAAGTDIPDTRTTGYTRYLSPASIKETSGPLANQVTRTTTFTYRTGDQFLDKTTVETSALAGSTPIATTQALYDAKTKVRVGTANLDSSGQIASRTLQLLDQWGRTTSYTDASGNTTNTNYVAGGTPGAGQIATVSDSQDTATYTYDGVDAVGSQEHRGLPTQVNGYRSGPWKAAYDAAGNLTTQTMPGAALTQQRTYDTVNRLTSTKYSDMSGTLVSFDRSYNGAGQVDADSDSTGRTTSYIYDGASRLASAAATTPAAGATPASCTTRSYRFDVRGNRTSMASASGSSCTTASPATGTYAYDNYSRQQTGINGSGAYTYDAFGRQTTIPASDAANGTNAATSIAYYDTDAVRSLTQSGATTTFALDPAGRRLSETTGTATTVNAYGDTDDSPAWATKTQGSTVTTTRFVSDLTGGLGAQIDTTGGTRAVYVPLMRPSGSIAASISIPGSGPAVVAGPYVTYDEYGRSAGLAASTGVVSYGWHGRDQRERSDSGLSLMGARLYNPSTARFTSEDPIAGGNENAYNYPNDPVNQMDLSGTSRMPDSGPGNLITPGGGESESILKMIGRAIKRTSGETSATKFGREMHKNWNYGKGFVKEFRLKSGRRVDALNKRRGVVVELKPNNPRAIKQGWRQVNRYVKELNETYPRARGSWVGKVVTYEKK